MKSFITRSVVFACLTAVLFLTSCITKTKVEYRDRDVNHYITNEVHDTLRIEVKDSTYHLIRVVNDTVYDTKYVERTRWRDRAVERHDTCWRDSVVTEYKETVKEVTKIPKLYRISLVFSFLMIIFALIKFTKWLRIV
jgi:hypothetical protein